MTMVSTIIKLEVALTYLRNIEVRMEKKMVSICLLISELHVTGPYRYQSRLVNIEDIGYDRYMYTCMC